MKETLLSERNKRGNRERHLVFFDIDGTLAIGKDVPASARKGIASLRENGDLVFICTGRNHEYVKKNFSEYADGFICSNGRIAYYEEKVIYDEPIDEETLNILLSLLRKVDAGFVFHNRNEGFYEGPEELFEMICETGDSGYVKKGMDLNKGPFYNFDVCFHDEGHRERIKEALKDLCIMNPHGDSPHADMSVKGADKGDALRAVADRLDVRIEDTYAFGDGLNDISMLKAAGHAIAMGNGQMETKRVAEYVSDDILKDGVYKGLKHYGLI